MTVSNADGGTSISIPLILTFIVSSIGTPSCRISTKFFFQFQFQDFHVSFQAICRTSLRLSRCLQHILSDSGRSLSTSPCALFFLHLCKRFVPQFSPWHVFYVTFVLLFRCGCFDGYNLRI